MPPELTYGSPGAGSDDFEAFVETLAAPGGASDDDPTPDDAELDDADESETEDDESEEEDEDADDEDADDDEEDGEDDDEDDPPASVTKRRKPDPELAELTSVLSEIRGELRSTRTELDTLKAASTKADAEAQARQTDAAYQELYKRWQAMPPEEVAKEQGELVRYQLALEQKRNKELVERQQFLEHTARAEQQHNDLVAVIAEGTRQIDGKLVRGAAKPLTERETRNLSLIIWDAITMQEWADETIKERRERTREARQSLAAKRQTDNRDAERVTSNGRSGKAVKASRPPTSIEEYIDDLIPSSVPEPPRQRTRR